MKELREEAIAEIVADIQDSVINDSHIPVHVWVSNLLAIIDSIPKPTVWLPCDKCGGTMSVKTDIKKVLIDMRNNCYSGTDLVITDIFITPYLERIMKSIGRDNG